MKISSGGSKSWILTEEGREFIVSSEYKGGRLITPFTAYQDGLRIEINLGSLVKKVELYIHIILMIMDCMKMNTIQLTPRIIWEIL